MKQFAFVAVLLCLAGSVSAQDDDASGLSLMQRGAKDFFDGMKRELAPAMDSLSEWSRKVTPALRDFTEEMGPAFADLLENVEDWSVYEPPQKLPNGDIIIKRKPEPPVEDDKLESLMEDAPQIDL